MSKLPQDQDPLLSGRDALAGRDVRGSEGADFGLARDRVRDDEQVVQLAEEYAQIGKRVVEQGVVRVRTETEVVDEVARASMTSETAEVSRHPVNRYVDAMPEVREDGDTLIMPVVEERVVVEKRLFVTEEIHIRRVRSTEAVEVPVSLRRQRAVVERLDPDGAPRERT